MRLVRKHEAPHRRQAPKLGLARHHVLLRQHQLESLTMDNEIIQEMLETGSSAAK
jgi:hypothetical protein